MGETGGPLHTSLQTYKRESTTYIYIYTYIICCHVQNAPFGRKQCLPPHTAVIVCCDTQQTCLLCDTADMSAVSHSRHVCCVKQQTCLLCQAADMSAVSRSRHVCCITRQTCLLCHTAGSPPEKVITWFRASANSPGCCWRPWSFSLIMRGRIGLPVSAGRHVSSDNFIKSRKGSEPTTHPP